MTHIYFHSKKNESIEKKNTNMCLGTFSKRPRLSLLLKKVHTHSSLFLNLIVTRIDSFLSYEK